MKKNLFFICLLLLTLGSCRKEETLNVLRNEYDATVRDAEDSGEDFIVNLHARALQKNESGEWRINQGPVVDKFVYFEDPKNPLTRFKGLPGEEYTLEWTRRDANGNTTTVTSKVKIPVLNIEIADLTPPIFKTIRTLSVNPKYKGKWSFDQPFGYLTSRYHDGYAEPAENKPSVELHGYANTTYTVTYTYNYAGKPYTFQKIIQTGDYTQDEGLFELQLERGSHRALEDKEGNIIELNLQSEGIAYVLNDIQRYPALQSFKKLRKLNVGGSSLGQIPEVFGDHYKELEQLDMDGIGENLVFPENFGNLTKLKSIVLYPLYAGDMSNTLVLPKSFGRLKALESLTIRHAGYVNFNGTLGQLTNLKYLSTDIKEIPENIGDLKKLEYIDLLCNSTVFPKRFGECAALTFVRINFGSTEGQLMLSGGIGNLKQLKTLELSCKSIAALPASFTELSSLTKLRLENTTLQSIPEDFGDLSNLEDVTIFGSYTKVPNSFSKLHKLLYLTLAPTVENLPESIGDLSSLVYFNLWNGSLIELPESFGRLKNLKEIDLGNSRIEQLPESFSGLDALEKLNLSYSQLKTFPKSLIPLKKISMIYLNGCRVNDIPDDISKMKDQVTFYLYGVPNLTYEFMTHIKSIARNKIFYTDAGYF